MSNLDPYYRPPQAERPASAPDAPDDQDALREALLRAEPATILVRGGAYLIDTAACLAVSTGVGAVVGAFAVLAAGAARNPSAATILGPGLIFGLLGPVAYHSLSEAVGGTTLGMLLCGLRVRNEELGKVSFGAAVGRNFALYFDLLFCGIPGITSMMSSRMKQRYGDQWAHTYVVYARSVAELRSVNVALGIMAGAAGLAVCTTLQQVLTFFR